MLENEMCGLRGAHFFLEEEGRGGGGGGEGGRALACGGSRLNLLGGWRVGEEGCGLRDSHFFERKGGGEVLRFKFQVSKFRGQSSEGREKDEGGEWVGKSPDFMPQFLKPLSSIRLLGNLPRRVNVKPPPNNAGLATAILHRLNPAKDFLGVGLADGESEHG